MLDVVIVRDTSADIGTVGSWCTDHKDDTGNKTIASLIENTFLGLIGIDRIEQTATLIEF